MPLFHFAIFIFFAFRDISSHAAIARHLPFTPLLSLPLFRRCHIG
jgi:hypothetical protein